VLDTAFPLAGAVVVLLTPDEIAYLQPRYADGDQDPDTQPAEQARPNVLFEAGLAFGHHPDTTILVQIGRLRPFSDIAGRHIVHLSDSPESRQALAARLKTAGCPVETTGIDWLSAGDFSTPEPAGLGRPLGRRVPSTRATPAIDIDLRYRDQGRGRVDKLQVVNRGSAIAREVKLVFPQDAALTFTGSQPDTIDLIPGNGGSVTMDVWNQNRTMGPNRAAAFYVSISARTEDDEGRVQEVWIDTNGG
jgi:hypothetical protein